MTWRIQSVSKTFGSVVALKDFTLDLPPGRITALVGDNGSGKTTLIRMLSGTLAPDSGAFVRGGVTYSQLTPQQAKALGIATVYQDLALDEHRSAYLNLFLGDEIRRFGFWLDHRAMRRHSRALLDHLHINLPDIQLPVGVLSGGQRQTLAIARALRRRADLILFDEPTAAMGVKETQAANSLIRKMRDDGRAVFLISHDMYQVAELADRICFLRHGHIIDVSEAPLCAADIMNVLRCGP